MSQYGWSFHWNLQEHSVNAGGLNCPSFCLDSLKAPSLRGAFTDKSNCSIICPQNSVCWRKVFWRKPTTALKRSTRVLSSTLDFMKKENSLKLHGDGKEETKHHRGRRNNFLSNLSSLPVSPITPSVQPPPSRLEIHVRVCVERIFSPFFSPTDCNDSTQALEQDWEERKRAWASPASLSLSLLAPAPLLKPTVDRQIWRNSSVVGCVKEVGTETTGWLWKKTESWL